MHECSIEADQRAAAGHIQLLLSLLLHLPPKRLRGHGQGVSGQRLQALRA